MTINDDIVIACTDLAGRAGARDFEIAWDCPHTPGEPDDHNCPHVTWSAAVGYLGARVFTAGHPDPTTAALALAQRLLKGAACRCGQPVSLSEHTAGCRWRLMGARWEPGCDAPPVRVQGHRGDHAAMRRALAETTANRAERRAARKRGGR